MMSFLNRLNGWRVIDTAPTDGTQILILYATGPNTQYITQSRWDPTFNNWETRLMDLMDPNWGDTSASWKALYWRPVVLPDRRYLK
jgi:hypothetical protein